MKKELIIQGIIAILRAILPTLERRAKESPSPIDDIVIGILRVLVGLDKLKEKDLGSE